MRKTISWNSQWEFYKGEDRTTAAWEQVDLSLIHIQMCIRDSVFPDPGSGDYEKWVCAVSEKTGFYGIPVYFWGRKRVPFLSDHHCSHFDRDSDQRGDHPVSYTHLDVYKRQE